VNSRALQEYDVIKNAGQYYETHYNALYNYYKNATSSKNPYLDAVNGLTSNSTGGLGYNVYNVPAGQYLIGTNGKLNPSAKLGNVVEHNGQKYMLLPDNWLDQAYQTSFRQEYNASVSAATQKANFFASVGYLDNTGIIKGSELSRITSRLKADYQAKKWLKVGANMSYSHISYSNGNSDEGESGSTANIFAFASGMAPIYPVYIRDDKGNIMVDQYGYQMYDYGAKDNAGLTRPNLPNSNALQTSWLNKYTAEGNAFTASGFAELCIYRNLKLTVNAATAIDEKRYTDVMNPYYGQMATSGGGVSKAHQRSLTYNLQQLLTYKETFANAHTIDLMLGHEYYNAKGYSLSAYKTMIADYDNDELAGAVVDGAGAGSSRSEYNTEGYFFRAGYDYDNRIFASASFRRDASSNFHPDRRWGNFWSVGAAWVMNRESWFPQNNVVDILKLKASYGSQGNDAIGSYRYTDTYTYENNDGEVAILFNSKGNPNITWETNTNLNVGVEFGLWQNRLYGSIDYFNRKTSDMLFFFSVPSSLGYSGYYANVGDMVNQGIEVELGADLIRRKNFNWSLNLNLSHIKNKITYLADEHKTNTIDGYNGYISGSYFHAEGLPLYTMYMRSYAGVDKNTGESMWWKDVVDDKGNVTGREKTTNYSQATRYLKGDAMADVYGGFTTSLNFYGVDVSANFTYQIGGLVYDSGYADYMSSPKGTTVGSNYHRDILNAWTPENSDSNIPRLQYGDEYTTAMSDRFLTDASYLNIQNITVGYTLPSKITRKFLVERLRLYVVCDNVWYWSRRKGLDPRQYMTGGTNNSTYSPIRTISGGINITF
jgi:TonB-linked SusC/RagA family outer membrane protein